MRAKAYYFYDASQYRKFGNTSAKTLTLVFGTRMLKGLEKIIARGTVGLLQNSRKRMQNLELTMMKQNAKLRNKLDSKQRKRQDESLKKSKLLKNQKKK
jgi:hypothetical protein